MGATGGARASWPMLCETQCLEAIGRAKISVRRSRYRSFVLNSKGTRRITCNFNYFNYQQDDKRGFLERVEACVRESQETVYENEDGSSLRFTEPKPAHVCCSWRRHPRLVTKQMLCSWNYGVLCLTDTFFSSPFG